MSWVRIIIFHAISNYNMKNNLGSLILLREGIFPFSRSCEDYHDNWNNIKQEKIKMINIKMYMLFEIIGVTVIRRLEKLFRESWGML